MSTTTRYRFWMRLSLLPLVPMRLLRWHWYSPRLADLCGYCQQRAYGVAASPATTGATEGE